MRFTVNVELTDDELRKFVEDSARRWTLNTIKDVARSVRMKPETVESLLEMMMRGASQVREQRDRERHPQTPPNPWPPHRSAPSPYPPPPSAAEEDFSCCVVVDGGWECCRCKQANRESRGRCRVCDHERCFMPSPSDPEPDEENDA